MKKPQYRHVHWLACLLVSQPPASMAAGLDKQEPAEQHAIDTPILRTNAVLSPKEQARWQVVLEDMKRIISNRSTSPATPPTDQTKATDLPSVPKAATELFRRGFEASENEEWVPVSLEGNGEWSFTNSGTCPTASPYSGSSMGKFNSCVATTESAAALGNATYIQIPASATRATMTLRMFHDTNNPASLDFVLPAIAADGGDFLLVGPEGDEYGFFRHDGTSGWALESMDISYLIGSTIQVAFAGMSLGGGNMYIDEVIVSSEKGGTQQYTVTASVGTGGKVEPSTRAVDSGKTAAFTVTPNSGYTRNSTVGGACPQGSWNSNVWTTAAITKNCDVKFTFNSAPTNKSALESPQQNSFESGIGLIRGWSCDAKKIEVEIDGKTKIPVAYGTPRDDTKGTCGDSNNGFGLTYNWNLLSNGTHTIKAFADDVAFATTNFTTTNLGVEYLTGVGGDAKIANFPAVGRTTTIRWSEPHQNFVIVPTTKSQLRHE